MNGMGLEVTVRGCYRFMMVVRVTSGRETLVDIQALLPLSLLL